MASSSAAASAASAASAMAELALDRERAAMAAEDAQSFIAQRYFFRSAQLPPVQTADRTFTWERAYNVRHDNWLDALQTMRDALRANTAGDAQEVRQTLLSQVDDDMEEAEEEEMEVDEEVEEEELAVQPFTGAAHQLPPTCVPFTGTAHRLS